MTTRRPARRGGAGGSPDDGGPPAPLGAPLPPAFYDRDPCAVARGLLGAVLVADSSDGRAAGVVVETEAYLGADDPACHAVVGRTRRTWHLFGPPGIAYVYRIYGMHWCVNAVTLAEGIGSAVLVRALRPVEGEDLMRRRRPLARRAVDVTNGPGKLCAALGITGALDGHPLDAPPLQLLAGDAVPDSRVVVTPRIGITRGAELPLRYLVGDDPFVSATPTRFPRVSYRPPRD